MSELFPTELRGLGIGAWYNLTVAVFGGTAPLVIQWLGDAGHSNWFFWYVAAGAVMAFVAILTLPGDQGVGAAGEPGHRPAGRAGPRGHGRPPARGGSPTVRRHPRAAPGCTGAWSTSSPGARSTSPGPAPTRR